MNDFNEGLLQAANFTPLSLQVPDGWCGHLPFAAWLMKQLRPALYVELGTHSGNSYFAFCQAAREENIGVKCYAVDTWQGDEHAGSYGGDVFEQVSRHNQTHYAGFSRLLRMTFDDAVNYFSDASIDLLHIDGLHTYEAVRHDFETWLPKLAPGAIVLFHDINVRERGFGVWKLWEELQQRYAAHHEFVHSHGLGVLCIGGAGEATMLPWLHPGCVEQHVLRNYFSALGARQVERLEVQQSRIQLAAARQQIAERDALITHLHEVVAEHSGNLHVANTALAQRDVQMAEVHTALDQLRKSQVEHEEQREALTAALAERDAQLAAARQELAERDGKAVATWRALKE